MPENTTSQQAPTDKIKSIEIKNFKRINETHIPINSITYLVGGNNSGKSSVLQAIHTAVSCAQASVERGEKVVAESSLRYSPVADFKLLGHTAEYENNYGGSRGSVRFIGLPDERGTERAFTIEMYKARNHGNVGVERRGLFPGFGQIICDPQQLFSVYVPGLAGVPHREELSEYASVFAKAASGGANFVFRNIIRLLNNSGKIEKLEKYISDVLNQQIHFKVDFDPERDIYVDVKIKVGNYGKYLPIDLWGTGLLQITQIFSYALLFTPTLFLIDEPDSHLHPSMQKNLASSFKTIANELGCQIIVSTHSRHLISSATNISDECKIIWMKNGDVESADQPELATILMDLGALDQFDSGLQAIICTEDSDSSILEKSLRELGYTDSEISINNVNGVNNVYSAEALNEMAGLMSNPPKILVHRDRDFLTDNELSDWSKVFDDKNIQVFCPPMCDTEFYLTTVQHIQKVTHLSQPEAINFRNDAITQVRNNLRKKLFSKRETANRKYAKLGGSPITGDLWPDDVTIPDDKFIYGKLLLETLDKNLKTAGHINSDQSLADEVSDEMTQLLQDALDNLFV